MGKPKVNNTSTSESDFDETTEAESSSSSAESCDKEISKTKNKKSKILTYSSKQKKNRMKAKPQSPSTEKSSSSSTSTSSSRSESPVKEKEAIKTKKRKRKRREPSASSDLSEEEEIPKKKRKDERKNMKHTKKKKESIVSLVQKKQVKDMLSKSTIGKARDKNSNSREEKQHDKERSAYKKKFDRSESRETSRNTMFETERERKYGKRKSPLGQDRSLENGNDFEERFRAQPSSKRPKDDDLLQNKDMSPRQERRISRSPSFKKHDEMSSAGRSRETRIESCKERFDSSPRRSEHFRTSRDKDYSPGRNVPQSRIRGSIDRVISTRFSEERRLPQREDRFRRTDEKFRNHVHDINERPKNYSPYRNAPQPRRKGSVDREISARFSEERHPQREDRPKKDDEKFRRHNNDIKDRDQHYSPSRKAPQSRRKGSVESGISARFSEELRPPQRGEVGRNERRRSREHERGNRKYDRSRVRPSIRRSDEREQDIPSGINIKKEPISPERTKWDSGNEDQEYERKHDKKKGAKEKPNFALSGKLAEETNTFRGVVIKYSEPPEARIPKKRWRFYVFKDNENMPTLYMHRQSAYLIGRDRKVCDLAVDHPSCSKQHAALQYRLVPYEKADGRRARAVRPYVIDLGSSNGTFVNNKPIEPQRYVELREKDVLKFGFSSREYVLLHDESKDDILDDDYQED